LFVRTGRRGPPFVRGVPFFPFLSPAIPCQGFSLARTTSRLIGQSGAPARRPALRIPPLHPWGSVRLMPAHPPSFALFICPKHRVAVEANGRSPRLNWFSSFTPFFGRFAWIIKEVGWKRMLFPACLPSRPPISVGACVETVFPETQNICFV